MNLHHVIRGALATAAITTSIPAQGFPQLLGLTRNGPLIQLQDRSTCQVQQLCQATILPAVP